MLLWSMPSRCLLCAVLGGRRADPQAFLTSACRLSSVPGAWQPPPSQWVHLCLSVLALKSILSDTNVVILALLFKEYSRGIALIHPF